MSAVSNRSDDTSISHPSRSWWALALRGVAAIIFGVLAMLWPGATLLTLVVLVAAYFLLDGVLAIVSTVRAARGHQRWWAFALEGVLNVAIGVLFLAMPQMSALSLIYLLAVWAIFTGVVMVFGGTALVGAPRWLLTLAGALSVLLGIAIITQPAAGAFAIAFWVGTYGILFGATLLGVALSLRRAGCQARWNPSPT
jgi:uncharacterized membrane protein HdeD (DUF308 family)